MSTISPSIQNRHPVLQSVARRPWILCLLLTTGCGIRTALDVPNSELVGADASPGQGGSVVGTGGTSGTGGMTGTGGHGGTSASGGAAGATTTWPASVTVNTCEVYKDVTVGSYVIETDYWNQSACPGTQCMSINSQTGEFVVTQAPNCGDTVVSYPNVLYGCSFGTCSPGSALPKMVSTLGSVTSSWSFSVGGSATDKYDVAYDIWFCPDNTCGSGGFTNGAELMIWLDYQNVSGWQTHLGSVSLAGFTWDVWLAKQGTSGLSWTYLAYMIQAPMQTSVTNLDLKAFIQDAVTRGYVKNSWYLYAIQAGDELRTGGLPYRNLGFSASVQ